MISYTDYNFYKDTYMGTMPENDFERLVIGASYEVRKNIFNKQIDGFENEVALATCSVTDILLRIEQIEAKKAKLISDAKEDKVLASEQVADLHRSFANVNKTSDLDVEISNQKEKIKEAIKKYLLTTGLLYRRIM